MKYEICMVASQYTLDQTKKLQLSKWEQNESVDTVIKFFLYKRGWS